MRKRTQRKHYALRNPIEMAISGARIADEGTLDRLRMMELSALQAFATGAATQADWSTIADIVNLAQTMCEMGIGKAEVLPATEEVERVLGEAHARFGKTGRVGTTGPGLQAMRDLQEWHDLQRTSVARSVYEQAIVRTSNRIRSADPSVKVFISEGAAA